MQACGDRSFFYIVINCSGLFLHLLQGGLFIFLIDTSITKFMQISYGFGPCMQLDIFIDELLCTWLTFALIFSDS